MLNKGFRRTKFACYYTNLANASAFSLPPILFLTFNEMYGISYTLLGTLVLVNFFTQLLIDLVFTFFSSRFNIKKTVCVMPLLTSLGFIIYALVPALLPQYAYAGLLAGTIVFSVAAGLNEVLISPLIAAMPSDNPERDMSKLHSLYGYGVVSFVILGTVFIRIFGSHNWMYLVLLTSLFPVLSSFMYFTAPIPEMDISHGPTGGNGKRRGFAMALCVACIFLGSAAENTMTNWISGFMENALGIPKITGDILGMALFAALLAMTRSVYAKYGRNISNMLLVSMTGAAACYLVAAICPVQMISMIACVATGVCTSMLWPGTLILMEEKLPGVGVTAYALMAAGGDCGASVAPQMLGVVVDTVAASGWGIDMAAKLAMTPDQLGMKVGVLAAAVFPILGTALLIYMRKYFAKHTDI